MSTVAPEKPVRKYAPHQFEAEDLPDDEEYRASIIRLLRETGEMASNPKFIEGAKKFLAFAEIAPGPADRLRITQFVADELRHGLIFEGLLHQLGEDTTDVESYSSIEALNFVDSLESWADLAVMNTIGDRAGGFQLQDYELSSYAPLARAGTSVARDERGHAAMGLLHLRAVCETEEGRKEAQRCLEHWYPLCLDMFGTSTGKRQWRYIELGLKTKTNEELRQEYLAEVNPILEELGLDVPDPLANRKFL